MTEYLVASNAQDGDEVAVMVQIEPELGYVCGSLCYIAYTLLGLIISSCGEPNTPHALALCQNDACGGCQHAAAAAVVNMRRVMSGAVASATAAQRLPSDVAGTGAPAAVVKLLGGSQGETNYLMRF